MYFSRVRLNQSLQAMNQLKHLFSRGSYQSHQMLWKLFSNNKRHFLFRQEQSEGAAMPVFYLLSEQEPIDSKDLFEIETKVFEPKLAAGDELGFKLRVNPTICIENKRHDVLMHAKKQAQLKGITDPDEIKNCVNDAAVKWLINEKRCEDLGISYDCEPTLVSQAQHVTYKKNTAIRYTSADFAGRFTVTNPEKFLPRLYDGIGKSKAFGCGLFLIRRL